MNLNSIPEESHITYRMNPGQRPTSPLRLWHGIVLERLHGDDEWEIEYRVELIDEGYEGLLDRVSTEQIIQVGWVVDEDAPPPASLRGI